MAAEGQQNPCCDDRLNPPNTCRSSTPSASPRRGLSHLSAVLGTRTTMLWRKPSSGSPTHSSRLRIAVGYTCRIRARARNRGPGSRRWPAADRLSAGSDATNCCRFVRGYHLSTSTIAAATSPRLLRPHWWLWRERRRWKRDDLLSVRLAPHAIQSLITTRTSNCDYLLLPFVYIAVTIHQSSPTAQAMRDIP